MKKDELVKSVAEENNISKATAKKVIDSTFEKIKKAVSSGDSFRQDGFGTFKKAIRAQRNGVNPGTLEKIIIPEKNVVKFNASPSFFD